MKTGAVFFFLGLLCVCAHSATECLDSGGNRQAVGTRYTAANGCNCFCTRDGQSCLFCSRDGCPGPNGKVYRPGEGYYDGCNNCVCQPGGGSICTLRACPPFNLFP
ncbi:hypothetical protein V1264_022828 [Littorina saxatilis]|uniref:Pacifastin domain-containing protein n=1 Tax=Littorina saxatilis TaxID=31220 RepID=A0AAN9B6I8_9CAEN